MWDFRSAYERPANGYDNNKYDWTLDRFGVENEQMVMNEMLQNLKWKKFPSLLTFAPVNNVRKRGAPKIKILCHLLFCQFLFRAELSNNVVFMRLVVYRLCLAYLIYCTICL